MKKDIFGISAVIILILGWILLLIIKDTSKTSTPVEEMYHRQLVVTLDSILNARFGSGCYKEDTDTVNANTFCTRFSGMISPME